jgi:hypothetical protein
MASGSLIAAGVLLFLKLSPDKPASQSAARDDELELAASRSRA